MAQERTVRADGGPQCNMPENHQPESHLRAQDNQALEAQQPPQLSQGL